MKIIRLLFVLSTVFVISCNSGSQEVQPESTEITFQNNAHELIYNMVQKVGTYQDLLDRKDVEYTYTYTTPDGKTDVSAEKYIFDGELSYAKYDPHERTLAQYEGPLEQGYDGREFWIRHNGEYITDEEAMTRATFNRKTNFYWFSMMQKLLDPGLNYTYVKEDTVNNLLYDVVKVTFDSPNGKPTDIYQLYLNRETGLADQFLFTIVDFGMVDTPFLMRMEYEDVDGLLIPTKRKYMKANWEAEPQGEEWIQVQWTNIRFNNGLSTELFQRLS